MGPSASSSKFCQRGAHVSVLLLAATGAFAACSQSPKTPGQLVVAIDTDMALPTQIDVIELVVTANGNTLLDNPMPVGVGTNTQTIPATLTLVAGDNPDLPATIKVIGWRNNQPRTLRQIVTPIPTDRIAVLRMPVQWLCDGTVTTSVSDDAGAGASYDSTCGDGMTCVAGSCVVSKIDPAKLETYTPQAVFGGAAAPSSAASTTSGNCFDTVPCLGAGTLVQPDSSCTMPAPSDMTKVNVGMRVAGDGICDLTGTSCFVPLDGNSDEGWTQKNGRIALPPAACTKLQSGKVAGIVMSTQCATKTTGTPTCGPWSSVAQTVVDAGRVTVEASASQVLPTAPSRVATVGSPDAGAPAPCCPLMADGSKLYTCLCAAGEGGAGTVSLVSIDPATGQTAPVASLAPLSQRSRYSAALAGGNVYWVDRQTSGDAGVTCPVYATSVSTGMTSQVGTVAGDVYDQADVLAGSQSLYLLADNVGGLPSTASPLQLVSVDRTSGAVAAHDTGGARPVFQFAQDATNVYVAADSDMSQGDGGAQRTSSVLGFPVAGTSAASTSLAQSALTTPDPSYGGYVGLVDDGTTLFALYQSAPAADGTIDTQIQKVGASGTMPTKLYDEVALPTVSQLRLLGAASGAVIFARDVAGGVDGGAKSPESSVLVLAAGQTVPRIVAGFVGDSPVFALQAPSFTPDVFWMNGSGQIFRLPGQVLK
ncbi:MAG: hypothetical protein ACRENE_27115 [Polyangiaceae bacterium]